MKFMIERVYPQVLKDVLFVLADKIAYLGRDIEDALIADFISVEEIPEKIRYEVGETNGEIINNLIIDIITTSKGFRWN